MFKKYVYVILVEFSEFDDWQDNYTELGKVFSNYNSALKDIKRICNEFIQNKNIVSNDKAKLNGDFTLKDVKKAIKTYGFVELNKMFGFGRTKVILEKKEVVK